jgi:dihydropteroate synthase
VQNTAFSTNKTLNLGGSLMNFHRPRVMGILNVTPDSFYDGGRFDSAEQVVKKAGQMLHEGADIIDVGGYSSRPGADVISTDEETQRVLKAIRPLIKHFPGAVLSIDTFRSVVARAAVEEGALMVNDISGGELDPEMFKTVADLRVPYVLMHMRGDPQSMARLTHYNDPVKEIIDYFHKKIHTLTLLGIRDIIIDPGFGFAKTREQNFLILQHLEAFSILEKPLMAGLSRKSMVWKTLGIKPEEALNGTSALHAVALFKGADILRVHDVRECKEVISLMAAIKYSSESFKF